MPPPSLLLALQDNIIGDIQPTTVTECDSELLVDLSAAVLPAVIVPGASDEDYCGIHEHRSSIHVSCARTRPAKLLGAATWLNLSAM